MKKKCNCKDPGYIEIDKEADKYAGIKGLIDLFNIKVVSNEVICLGCGKTIYKQGGK